jgi:ABC-type phosphate transport system auxiliary subunit
MTLLGFPVVNHTSDQPTDTIHKGLDTLVQSVRRLRSDVEDLQRLKDLGALHSQQIDADIAELRLIHKQMRTRLERLPQIDQFIARSPVVASDPKMSCVYGIGSTSMRRYARSDSIQTALSFHSLMAKLFIS